MKKILSFIGFITITLSVLYAQAPPQKMGYQMVVRDANNELVSNQQVGVRLSIIKSSPNGNPVFVESHSATTNANALLTVQVGTGTPTPGSDLANIDWGSDDYYLQCDIDPIGGSNYTITGNQQLITVPYAFYSGKSAYADTSDYNNLLNRPAGNATGDILYWDSSDNQWHILPIGQQGQVLTVNNGVLTWISSSNQGNNAVPPTVVTDIVFNITGRSANVRGIITSAGSSSVITSGICWSTSPNPSLGNSYTTDGTSIDTFVSKASNLVAGTTYYARAYATSSVGTSYGMPVSFTTPTDCGTVTDYDGNVYQTVYIGSQCWMKENLRSTHYSNGVSITSPSPSTNTTSFPLGSNKYYYAYNNNSSNIAKYGALYSWAAIMNGAGSSDNNPSGIHGVCPNGWHVPSNSEWCQMENFLEPGVDVGCNVTGDRGSIAKQLAVPQDWQYSSNNYAPGYWHNDTTGCNSSGFSAIPSGFIRVFKYGSYTAHDDNKWYSEGVGTKAYYWTCTISTSGNYNPAYYRVIDYSNSGVTLGTHLTTWNGSDCYYWALSVRCVKN